MSLECIAQGVITYTPGLGATFSGEGISFCVRPAGFVSGAVLLTLDIGLIGNAGAVPPGLINNSNVRAIVTCRGAGGPPAITTIATKAVLYLGVLPNIGATQILIVTLDNTSTLADPDSMEIMVWRVF
jgi:hypothetical protein